MRLSKIKLKSKLKFTYIKSFILLLCSYYHISSAVCNSNAINNDFETPHNFNFIKLSHFGLLSSSGPVNCNSLNSLKSKLNIFSPKLSSNFPKNKIRNTHWLSLVLILAGDLELNPGPKIIRYPCGICRKACTRRQPAVACDGCDIWFHTKCMSMNSKVYDALNNISWYCFTCGLPNFSSGLFTSSDPNFDSLFNPFDSIESRCYSRDPTSFFDPQTPAKNNPAPILTSTPNPHQTTNLSGSKPPPKSKLSLLIINFQSLWNKRIELSNLASDSRSDIIIGTETWLTSGENGIKNNELLLDDYDIFRRDRPTRGGGVMIAVKKNLDCEQISITKESETIFCKIKTKGRKPLIVGSIYRPPDYSFEDSLHIIKEIYNVHNKNKGAIFWFGGDFNLPDIDWENQDIIGNQYLRSINLLFLEMAQDLGFSQIINVPTRGTSLLDLLFTNYPHFLQDCSLHSGLGDHEVVRIKASLQPIRKKPIKRKIQLWSRADNITLQKEAHELKIRFLNNFSVKDNVTDMWNYLKVEINNIIEKNVPTKETSSKCHQPWINSEVKKLIRKKNRWFTKAKKSNSRKVWEKYRHIKADAQRACRQAEGKYITDIFSEDNSGKKFWGLIKGKRQENIGIGDLKNKNNITTRDAVKKAELIHEQFDSVFSNPSPPINPIFDEEERLPDIENIKITRNGILKLFLDINPNKANGPDNLPGRFLKICAYELIDIYQMIFQSSLDQGMVPPDWKDANVVPLFKKGDKSKPENYRPISLTSLSCKLLEHVVCTNIMSHLDKFNVLDDAQHGFRKRRNCDTQLISTLHDFTNGLKFKEQIDAIFLDFSKAFDKVDHEGLLAKLEHLGIRNSLLDWIRSFLIGRNQKVLVEGMASPPTKVLSGVPQGTVLGPLLFLIYINDISNGLSEGTKLKLFADDSLLYRTIKSPKDSEILQKDLNTLQTWEKKWKMQFHPDKCQLLKITNKTNQINSTYKIHNHIISETNSAKYLGITIDSKLHWKKHYLNITKKASSTLAFIKRNLNKCPKSIREKCYTTLVRPSIEYTSAVWDPHHQTDIDGLEKIQKSAARFVTNNYCMEPGNTLKNYKSLGWDTLEERRLQKKLSIFQKARLNLIDIPTDHLTFNARQTRLGWSYHRVHSVVDSHKYSFFPQATNLWNHLPSEVKRCEDINIFIKQIKSLNLTSIKNKMHIP